MDDDQKIKEIQCLNCATVFSGTFCPHCGQLSKTRRLKVATVIKDFLDALSDSDKGFLRTVIDLSQNPGSMLRDYISGKRKRYLSAGKYSFFLIVIFTVFASYLENHFGWFETMANGIDALEMVQTDDQNIRMAPKETVEKILKEKEGAIQAQGEKKDMTLKFDYLGFKIDRKVSKTELVQFAKFLLPRYHATLFDYLKFFVVLWIPIFAFFSFIFFWSSGYNYAEHITVNSYIYAHILLIYILFSPLYWLMPNATMTTALTSTTAAFFYLIYSYFQFFSKRNYRLVKLSMSLLFSFSTYFIFLTTLITALASYIFVSNLDKL